MPLNAAGQFRFRLRPSLYVELEVHDVAVLDDVLLALLAQLARIAADKIMPVQRLCISKSATYRTSRYNDTQGSEHSVLQQKCNKNRQN